MSNFDPHQANRFAQGAQQVINSLAETNAKSATTTTSGHIAISNKISSNMQAPNNHSKLNALSRGLSLPVAQAMARPPPTLSRPRAKQRKWRVLVSIALLLPALAAIIGIVAWTISIEVANNDSTSQHHTRHHNNNNHHHHNPQQQHSANYYNNHQHIQPSFLKQSSSVQSNSNTNNQNHHQHELQQQQQQQNHLSSVSSAPQMPQPAQFRSRDELIQPGAPRRTARAQNQQEQEQQQQQQQQQQSNARPLSVNELEPAAEMAPLRAAEPGAGQARVEARQTGGRRRQAKVAQTMMQVGGGGEEEEAKEEAGDQEQAGSSGGLASGRERQNTLMLRNLNQVEALSGSANAEVATSGDSEPEPNDRNSNNNNNNNNNNYDGNRSSDSGIDDKTKKLPDEIIPSDQNEQNKPDQSVADEDTTSGEGDQDQTVEQRKTEDSDLLSMTQEQPKKTATSAPNKHKSHWMMSYAGMLEGSLKKKNHPAMTKGASKVAAVEQVPARQKANVRLSPSKQQETKHLQNNKYILTESGERMQPSEMFAGEQSDGSSAATNRQQVSELMQQQQQHKQQQQDDDISFEQIASAISSTLTREAENGSAAKDWQPPSTAGSESSSSSLPIDETELSSRQNRRRTTGEHVAEVIDHLVDRRRQQRILLGNEQARPQLGPQVVVVAPVGADGAHMKARSLVKEQDENKSSQQQQSSTKKPTQLAKKQNHSSLALKRSKKPLGARLLGVGEQTDQMKYSERVEVIEDDDSSSLLNADHPSNSEGVLSGNSQQQQQELDLLFPQTSHVSSHSSEPRFRSPRHFYQSNEFERYPASTAAAESAPTPVSVQQQQQQQQPQIKVTALNQSNMMSAQQLARMFSAEQLIKEHVLKSKTRQGFEPEQKVMSTFDQASQQQQQQPMAQQKHQPQPISAKPTSTSTTTPASTSSSTITTTPVSDAADKVSTNTTDKSNDEQMKSALQTLTLAKNPVQRHGQQQLGSRQQRQDQPQFSSSFQSVQVPALFMAGPARQHPTMMMMVHQQRPRQHLEPLQIMESQQVPQQLPMAADTAASQAGAQAQQLEQQQQQQQTLPVFQDQEIQVPAHMAESVIQDLQRSPSQVTGYLNGRPAMFRSIASPAMMQQYQQQVQVPAMAASVQQNYHQYHPAYNRYQPQQFFMPPQAHQQYQQQVVINPGYQQQQVAARREQEQLQQQHQQQHQYDELSNGPQKSSKFGRASLLSKALSPSSLVQPMAQKAFNKLLNSFSQQAAEQQAQVDSGENSQQETSSEQESSPNADNRVRQPNSGDPMQAADSSPEPAAADSATTDAKDAARASARSMRSLPIGARAPVSQQQVQMINDQEVAESYGPPPQYHMGGGGGGGGYHPPQHYQSEHDKKTKGITFHFGGGPIGGGTQLITSPMGIFKHLMIPLMPNPRVNLNGKVVFGVVLEKTTAFGPPPKKKYKFWG